MVKCILEDFSSCLYEENNLNGRWMLSLTSGLVRRGIYVLRSFNRPLLSWELFGGQFFSWSGDSNGLLGRRDIDMRNSIAMRSTRVFLYVDTHLISTCMLLKEFWAECRQHDEGSGMVDCVCYFNEKFITNGYLEGIQYSLIVTYDSKY